MTLIMQNSIVFDLSMPSQKKRLSRNSLALSEILEKLCKWITFHCSFQSICLYIEKLVIIIQMYTSNYFIVPNINWNTLKNVKQCTQPLQHKMYSIQLYTKSIPNVYYYLTSLTQLYTEKNCLKLLTFCTQLHIIHFVLQG